MQLLRNSDAKEATGSSPEAVAQASSVQDSSSANIKIDTSVDVKKPEFNPQGIAAQIKAKYNIDQKDSKTDAASQTEVKVEDGEKADEKEKLSEEGLVHNLNETSFSNLFSKCIPRLITFATALTHVAVNSLLCREHSLKHLTGISLKVASLKSEKRLLKPRCR